MNIKEERLKTGLSQQQLADKTGIPKDRIGKWEQGKGKPKAEDSKVLIEFFSNYDKEELPQLKDVQAEYAIKSELKNKGQSIERSIEILTEDRSRVLSVIERLTSLLERQYSKDMVAKLELAPPGSPNTETKIPEKFQKKQRQ